MNKITNNTETSIYVIDSDYHIVYFNPTLQYLFPALQNGDYCYRALCGENSPCDNCPIAKEQRTHAIFYNKMVQRWVDVSTGTVEWPGAGICQIMLAKSIDEGNKNLFYNLTSISPYDELYELNLTRNTYKILYNLEEKYLTPAPEGKLDLMVQTVADHLLHPEDREAFLAFWTRDNILTHIQNFKEQNSLTQEFRRIRPDGSYSWILQIVVPISYSENGDQVIMCFVQDIHEQKIQELSRNNNMLSSDVALNPLTGLYRRSVFFHLAQNLLYANAGSDTPYCLMAIDIEHFKLFNEWYGTAAGDDFLINIGKHLKQAQDEHSGIAGYIGNDDFAIILPYREELLSKLQEQLIGYIKHYEGSAGFLPAFGLYVIEDTSLPVNNMYDRACMALASVKGNYAQRCGRYDTAIMEAMEKNHLLLSEVQRALDQHEFTFYAQPKCNMATGRIIGLESLVRWNHPERGLIPPGDFIPLLESNGFISNLDLYIWEAVCAALRNWLDRGFRAIPISVNVSRVDIYALDIVEVFRNLTEKYQLEPRLVEIEITESAYTEDYHVIVGVVESLRRFGFTVLMDDFGSGYSSLNMLKDVNVDIIKLDMKFLDMNDKTSGKGIGILEAVTHMARLMNLRIIAEGIETKEQADLLLDMGCLYGQGYYFFRPMPIEVFEPLLMQPENVDYRGLRARTVERLGVRELLHDDLFSETMLNNILGAIAFYDVHDDTIELLRANEHYYKTTLTNPVDLAEYSQNMLSSIVEEDHEQAFRIFHDSYQNPVDGAAGDIRKTASDGTVIWLHLHAYFLREQDGHRLFYSSLLNITEHKQKELQLTALLESSGGSVPSGI